MRRLVQHAGFQIFIAAAIVANTLLLAMDHHPMEPGFSAFLEVGNFVLSVVFIIEMVLKLLGLGLIDYCRDSFNIFDAVIVGVSILELWLAPPSFFVDQTDVSQGGGLSALRTFRLFRAFKLAK